MRSASAVGTDATGSESLWDSTPARHTLWRVCAARNLSPTLVSALPQNLSHPDAAGAWLSALALLHGVFNMAVFFSSHGSVCQAWRDGCRCHCCSRRRCPHVSACWDRLGGWITRWRGTVRGAAADPFLQQATSSVSEPWSPLGPIWLTGERANGGDEEISSPVSDPTLEAWWDSWRRESQRESWRGDAPPYGVRMLW